MKNKDCLFAYKDKSAYKDKQTNKQTLVCLSFNILMFHLRQKQTFFRPQNVFVHKEENILKIKLALTLTHECKQIISVLICLLLTFTLI